MTPFEFLSAVAFLLVALVGLCVACYGLGRLHGSPVYTINGGLPPATDWGQVAAEVELSAEIVGYLEPVVVSADTSPFGVLPLLPPVPDLSLISAAQLAVDERDELVAKLASEVRSKRTALTRARIASAQVAGLVDVLLRPRRLSRAALVAATIEVGSTVRPLVPVPIAKKLEADEVSITTQEGTK